MINDRFKNNFVKNIFMWLFAFFGVLSCGEIYSKYFNIILKNDVIMGSNTCFMNMQSLKQGYHKKVFFNVLEAFNKFFLPFTRPNVARIVLQQHCPCIYYIIRKNFTTFINIFPPLLHSNSKKSLKFYQWFKSYGNVRCGLTQFFI